MIRFLGNEMHPLDLIRLDAWEKRILEYRDLGIEEVYFFGHQPSERTSPDLIAKFADRMRGHEGITLRSEPLGNFSLF
jgi:hypothetical protein